jgi:hypothetical protein
MLRQKNGGFPLWMWFLVPTRERGTSNFDREVKKLLKKKGENE